MTNKSAIGAEQAETSPTAEIAFAPEVPLCVSCGSDNIVRDAWASWNPDTQQWELGDVFDDAFCKACEETARIEWKAPEPSRTNRIRALNDAFRTGTPDDGMIVITSGVRSLGSDFVAEARNAVAAFSGFNEDNDPHGEHDFGSLDVGDRKLFFKIDYYDPEMSAHSPDAADPDVTKRVMTIMLASEY